MAPVPYTLSIDDVTSSLQVHTLTGNETISQTWHFDVVVSGAQGEEVERVGLGSRATLVFQFGDNPRAFYGVVASIAVDEVNPVLRYVKYRVRIVPRLWLLRRKRRSRVFQNMRVPDIVSAVLGEYGIASRFVLTRAYPSREYCTQYEETDYGFVRRILAESGMFFYFFGGPPISEGALAANMAVGAAAAAGGAIAGAIGGQAVGALVDEGAMMAQTLVPGDTVVGADDSTAYPGVGADDPAALAAATTASMAADVAGALGADSGIAGAAVGAASAVAGSLIAAFTQGSPPTMEFMGNLNSAVGTYDKIVRFGLKNRVRSTGAMFRDYDPDKPLVRLESVAVSSAPFPPSPFEIAAMAAAAAQNAATAVSALAPDAAGPLQEASETLGQVESVVNEVAGIAGQKVPYELYHHHGPFLFPKWAFASDEAPLILRQERRRASTATGEGGCSDFSPAHRFELHGHYATQIDGTYVVTSVTHHGEMEPAPGRNPQVYFNTFECAPASMPYPPKRPRRRSVQVALTATVVGPAKTDIHVDAKGQIKVQFHWDREGKSDDHSSCWLRSMQAWAGPSWGHQFIPRVGMEVVVVFEGGDPDKPMVLGSVYNATHPPSFKLPVNKTRSGVRTQSSPGGMGFNELSFEDATGQEEVYVRAQRNMREEIFNDRHVLVGAHVEERIGKSRSIILGTDLKEEVGGDHHTRVKGVHNDSVNSHRTSTVGGAYNVQVHGEMSVVVGTKDLPKMGELFSYGDYVVGAANAVIVRGEKVLRLQSGDSYIEVSPEGIKISADDVMIEGKTCTTLKGKGPGMKLGDAAEITAKEIKIISEMSSLLLDKEVKLDGPMVKLNCPGVAPKPTSVTKKTVTKKVMLALSDAEFKPIAGKDFILTAGGAKVDGTTGGNGEVEAEIPDETQIVNVTIFLEGRPEGEQLNLRFRLVDVPPIDTLAGVKMRLENLGYYWGECNETLDDFVIAALKHFQSDFGLEETGQPDGPTKGKLAEVAKI